MEEKGGDTKEKDHWGAVKGNRTNSDEIERLLSLIAIPSEAHPLQLGNRNDLSRRRRWYSNDAGGVGVSCWKASSCGGDDKDCVFFLPFGRL